MNFPDSSVVVAEGICLGVDLLMQCSYVQT